MSTLNIYSLPFKIGNLELQHRLIQGPLAGFSCAPFRKQFYRYTAPAYSVSEMISAHDVLYKHPSHSRYLYRAPEEKILCYQLAGHDPRTMALAALKLEQHGADLIDLNCGCPKTKIRKKGAGSALLDKPDLVYEIINAVRHVIKIPLTVKIRIQGNNEDIVLAKIIEQAGADALIIHGRRWQDDYDKPCNLQQIANIKKTIQIPVIANGDIRDLATLHQTLKITSCDAVMIARAGSGEPWLYKQLLANTAQPFNISNRERIDCLMSHLIDLSHLENERSAVMQSKSLIRYYYRALSSQQLRIFYTLESLSEIHIWLNKQDLCI